AQSDARAAAGSHRSNGVRRRWRALLSHPQVLRAWGVQAARRIHEPQRQRQGGRMETGLRILFLSVLVALSGCQSFRNWAERRQERREERQEEAREQAAQNAGEDAE